MPPSSQVTLVDEYRLATLLAGKTPWCGHDGPYRVVGVLSSPTFLSARVIELTCDECDRVTLRARVAASPAAPADGIILNRGAAPAPDPVRPFTVPCGCGEYPGGWCDGDCQRVTSR